MSPSELAEAGVLGLEDCIDPVEPENLSESRSTGSAGETKACKDDGHCTGNVTGADTAAFHSRPDLLTEFRKVHILDKLIIKENLKIHELRSSEKELSGGRDTNELSTMSKEREAFRLQLEKEKREVERLEKSLVKECKVKKYKDRARKVVKCSIMGKARTENKEDRALCDELLSGICNRLQNTHSAALVQHDSQAQDKCKTESVKAELSIEVAEEDTPQDLDQLPDSQCQELNCSESEPSAFSRNALNSSSDLKEEVGIHPVGCIYKKSSAENASVSKPEVSLAGETRLDDGAFDSGGKSHLPPEPKQRAVPLPVNNDLAEHEMPHSSEVMNSAPSSAAQDPTLMQLDQQVNTFDTLLENVSHNLVLNPNVKEHSNNNNNNHALLEKCKVSLHHSNLPEMTTKDEEGEPVTPVQTELHLTEEMKTFSPADECPHQQSPLKLPPDLPLEFDPGGKDEQNEDLPNGVQSTEVMRVSPGIQAQLNSKMREVSIVIHGVATLCVLLTLCT